MLPLISALGSVSQERSELSPESSSPAPPWGPTCSARGISGTCPMGLWSAWGCSGIGRRSRGP
eukprot:7005668-Pyramimonas_sp.AAC.1